MGDKLFATEPVRAPRSQLMKQYWRDEQGSTAIEYGLTSALISLLFISGASALGGSVNEIFSDVALLLSGPPELPRANSLG